MGATTLYGFSNIDMGKQIFVNEGVFVFAGISRANQTISIYHGETLIADCTMPSTGIENLPTIVSEKLTLHDDTFTGFIAGETYTIVAGDEPSITGFVINGMLFSFDASVMWAIFPYAGRIISQAFSESRTNYVISQKITTTKKRYDIKRLPEELLPKTAATKAEVREAQTTAETAQTTAETAQTTAETAQTTAETAQTTAETAQNDAIAANDRASSAETLANYANNNVDAVRNTANNAKSTADAAQTTAETAKSTADAAQTTADAAQTTAETAKSTAESVAASAVKARDGYLYTFYSSSADNPYPVISLSEKYRAVNAQLDENIGLILNISRDGGVNDPNTILNPATIKIRNMGGSGGVIVDGLRSLIMTSSTPNSTKQFKISVDDNGVISATEVVE